MNKHGNTTGKAAGARRLPAEVYDDLRLAHAMMTTVFLALGNEDGLDAGDPECLRSTLCHAMGLVNGARRVGAA